TETDDLADFIAECCELDPHARTPSSELYAAYCAWAREREGVSLDSRQFGRRLTQRGFAAVRGPAPKRARLRAGVKLRPEA
ncbi:primase-like DNA-binding domain-containing protein, partial [Acinetobacter baumannii]